MTPGIMRLCRVCGRRYKPHAKGQRHCARCAGKCPHCGERIPWVKVDRERRADEGAA